MLTASVVTYHTADSELTACLNSLSAEFFSRIFIIDNSNSESTHKLSEQWPCVEYIASDNIGYGSAHNIAIRKAFDLGTDYHLVINPDVYFTPSAMSAMLRYMNENTDTAALQPRIVYPDGRLQYTVRRLPTPLDLIGRRFLPKAIMTKRNAKYELHHINHDKPFNAPYHQGSFMLLRTAALKETGLFDERFFMYPEDIDLTRRLHSRYRTIYFPYSTVVHAHRAASYHSKKMLWIHIINMVKYFNKWGWWFDSERRKINAKLK